MSAIVECVPNFSEGRDAETIEAIAAAVRSTAGARLLDVDPGASTNRTVYTFVGSPEVVVEAAINAAKVAFNKIDMRKHKGEHPRMGALDVCPFIPVSNISEEECAALSKSFGKRLAEALDVPVFLYGGASQKDYRKTMPQIRKGEYEGLEEKLKEAEWAPDFGPSTFVPSWGGTVTGTRKFLIAYNVNMLSTKEQAHRIALNLREQGRGPNQAGRLKHVQGIGWYLDEKNIAQISLNLTDFDVTPIHVAYEEAKKDADELNLAVTGSEIVGLVPLSSLMMAAEYYMKKEKLFLLEEDQKILLAINRLGLSTLTPFNPKERIIEYCLDSTVGPLAAGSVGDFVRQVAARSPAPGGGSVAALVGAMGSALGAMVGQLTYGKRQWDHLDSEMRKLIPSLHQTANELVEIIDMDTKAFNGIMIASKLPKITDEDIQVREKAMLEATLEAINVPLSVMRKISLVWEPLKEMAKIGNPNCRSDIQVGARCMEAGAWGAYYNILINLDSLEVPDQKSTLLDEAKELLEISKNGCSEALAIVDKRKN